MVLVLALSVTTTSVEVGTFIVDVLWTRSICTCLLGAAGLQGREAARAAAGGAGRAGGGVGGVPPAAAGGGGGGAQGRSRMVDQYYRDAEENMAEQVQLDDPRGGGGRPRGGGGGRGHRNTGVYAQLNDVHRQLLDLQDDGNDQPSNRYRGVNHNYRNVDQVDIIDLMQQQVGGNIDAVAVLLMHSVHPLPGGQIGFKARDNPQQRMQQESSDSEGIHQKEIYLEQFALPIQ